MTAETASSSAVTQLLQVRNNLIIHQALYAAAKLEAADRLERGPRTTTDLARELKVNEDGLYRTLRALASQGIFEETGPRTFANSALSQYLRRGVTGSVCPLFIFFGTDFYYRSLERSCTASRQASQAEPN